MVKKVPSLKGTSKETLKDYFDVVKTYSPRAAANPIVAGHLVNKMVQFGGVDHKLVQDLTSINKNTQPSGRGSDGVGKLMGSAAGFIKNDY